MPDKAQWSKMVSHQEILQKKTVICIKFVNTTLEQEKFVIEVPNVERFSVVTTF